MTAAKTQIVSSGVEALIERLRQEGVAQGQAEAERLRAAAEAEAAQQLHAARQQAEQELAEARRRIDHEAKAAREALNVAARDTLLALKTQLSNRFAREVERLVSEAMRKEDLLKQMILEVAGRAAESIPPEEPLSLLLPKDVIGLEALRRNMEELDQGDLSNFVRGVTEDMLRSGVRFGQLQGSEQGLLLRLEARQISIDLTDQAVAALLLEHLQPRFRALLEGIVT